MRPTGDGRRCTVSAAVSTERSDRSAPFRTRVTASANSNFWNIKRGAQAKRFAQHGKPKSTAVLNVLDLPQSSRQARQAMRSTVVYCRQTRSDSIPSELLVKRVLDFLERETASARCFVAELRCGPRRLLLSHNDAVCAGCQREPRCEARKRSVERAERQGGVGRARLRGMLGVDGHVQGA